MPSKTSISITLQEASGTPSLPLISIPDESTSYDSTQEDGRENDFAASDTSSADYIPYITSKSLHAITSAADATAPSTLPINASFIFPNITLNQPQLMPAAIIIGVVVGVVGMFIGFGLILSYRRREKVYLSGESEPDVEGVRRMSYESGDSYVLQKARTQSVEFKKGILISIPSRGRVESAMTGPLADNLA